MHLHIMDSYSYTDHELVIIAVCCYKYQFLTRHAVLTDLLEYIDLFQSE